MRVAIQFHPIIVNSNDDANENFRFFNDPIVILNTQHSRSFLDKLTILFLLKNTDSVLED